MSQQIAQMGRIEAALIQGDLSKLSPEERLRYYQEVCHSLGLNQLTKPFDYILLNGKLTLYAKRDATDQLRKVHGVSIVITSREVIDGVYIVTAKGTDLSGRVDESTGVVSVEGLKGEAKANAFMKCETKAKRRVTLSLCGLGLLDETEIESIQTVEKEITAAPKLEIKNPLKELKQVSANPGEYVIGFGKYKNQKICDVTVHDLASYIEFIQQASIRDGKEIKGQVQEFIVKAYDFLDSRSPKSVEESNTEFMNEEVPF